MKLNFYFTSSELLLALNHYNYLILVPVTSFKFVSTYTIQNLNNRITL